MKALLKVSILFFSLILISCQPMTKESYLEDYKSFITEVRENHTEYSSKDWSKKSAKFNDFSSKWYDKYKEELTWKEQLLVQKYRVEYQLYSAKSGLLDIFKNKEVDDIKKQIKEYKEKGLEKDLDFLYKQAQEIGGETGKTVEEIFKELEIQAKDI